MKIKKTWYFVAYTGNDGAVTGNVIHSLDGNVLVKRAIRSLVHVTISEREQRAQRQHQ